ncbi:hypothetical protein ElyMa_005290000 [Elysia marginata]|uniref:Uncharacterized protein n=1 Tax=Elysia marginata TaxID=1093978 RepID=A0AAV4JYZ3_9GAST|nr:hypothetical protein ElyMa_005290000 [Elysia marginata]
MAASFYYHLYDGALSYQPIGALGTFPSNMAASFCNPLYDGALCNQPIGGFKYAHIKHGCQLLLPSLRWRTMLSTNRGYVSLDPAGSYDKSPFLEPQG